MSSEGPNALSLTPMRYAAFCFPTGLFMPRKHAFDKSFDFSHKNRTFKPPIHASAPQIGVTKFFSISGAANQRG